MDRIPLGPDPNPERYQGDDAVEGTDEAIEDLESERSVHHQLTEDAPTPTSEWKRQAKRCDAGPDVAPDGSITADNTDQRPNNQAHSPGIWLRMKHGFRKAIHYVGVLSLVALLLLAIVTTGLLLVEGPDGVGE